MHVPADLRLGAAQGDVLDVTVMRIIEGDSNAARQGKTRSLLTKFFTCAHETGALPLIPTRAATYFRFMCWLSANGIDSGWVGALKYVTAVVHLNRSLGFEDFRKHPATLFYWERFRRNFKQMVQSAHKAMKWPIRPGHLEAMALSTDLSIADNLAAICSYFLLFFCGCRIGHVAQSGTATDALRWEDIHFEPSLMEPTTVYVCFRSTKTRPRAADSPFWTAIGRQRQLPFCPVDLLSRHLRTAYRGRPGDFVFSGATGAALSRATFTANLRRRLAVAAPMLPAPVDLRRFSGVSFRKGCLSTLGALGLPSHRLADHADHSSVESSRIYTLDTLADRAANSTMIASQFLSSSSSSSY